MGAPGGALPIRPGPGLSDGLIIPASELVERFSRSPGPGGQSVNTSDTRVELEYDVAASSALTETQRRRTLDALGNRLVDGRPTVTDSEPRSQLPHRNHARARLPPL